MNKRQSNYHEGEMPSQEQEKLRPFEFLEAKKKALDSCRG
jgi:hypothetical protein